jgi:hypothetical protein
VKQSSFVAPKRSSKRYTTSKCISPWCGNSPNAEQVMDDFGVEIAEAWYS